MKSFNIYLLIFCTLLSNTVMADSEFNNTLREADIVFEGTVESVENRIADIGSTPGELVLPYTFVTYKVDRFLKGNLSLPRVTLRFLGGVDSEGAFMFEAHQPLFDTGDHDVLLVRNNNTAPCPLVGCARGRYRMVDGLLVNELGQTLELADDTLHAGQAVDLEEINTHKVSDRLTIQRESASELNGQDVVDAESLPPPKLGIRPDPAGFVSFMERKIQESHSYIELEQVSSFENADPDEKINDPIMRSVSSTSVAPPVSAQSQIPEDVLEEMRLEQEILAQRAAAAKSQGPLLAQQQVVSLPPKPLQAQMAPLAKDRANNGQLIWLLPLVAMLLLIAWFFARRTNTSN